MNLTKSSASGALLALSGAQALDRVHRDGASSTALVRAQKPGSLDAQLREEADARFCVARRSAKIYAWVARLGTEEDLHCASGNESLLELFGWNVKAA